MSEPEEQPPEPVEIKPDQTDGDAPQDPQRRRADPCRWHEYRRWWYLPLILLIAGCAMPEQ